MNFSKFLKTEKIYFEKLNFLEEVNVDKMTECHLNFQKKYTNKWKT